MSDSEVDFGIDFEIDFEIDFKIDFKIDFGLFILHFLEFSLYKFFIKKENCTLHAQIETGFFKLIDQKYFFFNSAFYLII